MDTLTNIHDMSIGELRKILKDNDVKETSMSKDELLMQVTDVLLTELTICDIMNSDTDNVPQDDVVTTDDKSLTHEQDIEYAEALRQDCLKQDALKQEDSFDELSPTSLREKRLAYYQ